MLRRGIYYEPNGELLMNKAVSYVAYAVLVSRSGDSSVDLLFCTDCCVRARVINYDSHTNAHGPSSVTDFKFHIFIGPNFVSVKVTN